MPIVSVVRRALYKDSIVLMRVAEALAALDGVREAALLMGTPANKEMLAAGGRLTADAAAATAEDLAIVVDAATAAAGDAALVRADELLASGTRGTAQDAPATVISGPRSLAAALRRAPDAALVAISTPGAYAGAEAMKALRRGRHVFLFSDHVPVEQEVLLKQLAQRKGLLVMGPDCGTAILAGTPLGFANVVRRGSIGLVGASGTGLQQVSTLVHRGGGGVSHVIGTGSRDLSDAVGGVTMRQGIALLGADRATDVIVLASKPPSPAVAAAVLADAVKTSKPVVAVFLGGDPEAVTSSGATSATTLEDAARIAVAFSRGDARAGDPRGPSRAPARALLDPIDHPAFDRALAARRPTQRWMRGLFSGGTLASEAQLVWRAAGVAAYSNAPLDKARALGSVGQSREHTALDMGSEEFTAGRPHPMIDYRARLDRVRQEAADPEVAVLLLDVVLGFGSHPDPASARAPVIREVAGRVAVVGSVCGTDDDPQPAAVQERALRDAGMVLAPSNAAAAAVAAALARPS